MCNHPSLYLTNWLYSITSVPIKAVDSVTVEWTTTSSVLVTWTPLSYIEARGFPLYLITYTSDDGSTSGSVNTTSSSVAITGLDPQYVYIFTVQVSTGNGNNKGGTEYGEHVVQNIVSFHPSVQCCRFHQSWHWVGCMK